MSRNDEYYRKTIPFKKSDHNESELFLWSVEAAKKNKQDWAEFIRDCMETVHRQQKVMNKRPTGESSRRLIEQRLESRPTFRR
jgi:hypothetical protein